MYYAGKGPKEDGERLFGLESGDTHHVESREPIEAWGASVALYSMASTVSTL